MSDAILQKYLENPTDCEPSTNEDIEKIKQALLQLAQMKSKNHKCKETLKNSNSMLTKAFNTAEMKLIDEHIINPGSSTGVTTGKTAAGIQTTSAPGGDTSVPPGAAPVLPGAARTLANATDLAAAVIAPSGAAPAPPSRRPAATGSAGKDSSASDEPDEEKIQQMHAENAVVDLESRIDKAGIPESIKENKPINAFLVTIIDMYGHKGDDDGKLLNDFYIKLAKHYGSGYDKNNVLKEIFKYIVANETGAISWLVNLDSLIEALAGGSNDNKETGLSKLVFDNLKKLITGSKGAAGRGVFSSTKILNKDTRKQLFYLIVADYFIGNESKFTEVYNNVMKLLEKYTNRTETDTYKGEVLPIKEKPNLDEMFKLPDNKDDKLKLKVIYDYLEDKVYSLQVNFDNGLNIFENMFTIAENKVDRKKLADNVIDNYDKSIKTFFDYLKNNFSKNYPKPIKKNIFSLAYLVEYIVSSNENVKLSENNPVTSMKADLSFFANTFGKYTKETLITDLAAAEQAEQAAAEQAAAAETAAAQGKQRKKGVLAAAGAAEAAATTALKGAITQASKGDPAKGVTRLEQAITDNSLATDITKAAANEALLGLKKQAAINAASDADEKKATETAAAAAAAAAAAKKADADKPNADKPNADKPNADDKPNAGKPKKVVSPEIEAARIVAFNTALITFIDNSETKIDKKVRNPFLYDSKKKNFFKKDSDHKNNQKSPREMPALDEHVDSIKLNYSIMPSSKSRKAFNIENMRFFVYSPKPKEISAMTKSYENEPAAAAFKETAQTMELDDFFKNNKQKIIDSIVHYLKYKFEGYIEIGAADDDTAAKLRQLKESVNAELNKLLEFIKKTILGQIGGSKSRKKIKKNTNKNNTKKHKKMRYKKSTKKHRKSKNKKYTKRNKKYLSVKQSIKKSNYRKKIKFTRKYK